jgi:D-alanine-D-alanine ligase
MQYDNASGCLQVGLTFDLRSAYLAAGYGEEETAEFDRDDTIDSLADALADLGHAVDRIGNARQLIQRLAEGDRWDLVFNICEGLRGIGRESQVPAILDVFDIPYTFSDPLVMGLCLHKGLTKLAVRSAGLSTPRFLVVERIEDLQPWLTPQRTTDCPPFPLFVKPVAEGTGKGVTPASRVQSEDALRQECLRQLALYNQPVLIEEFLPGREFTVGILGTGAEARVLGTLEIVLRDDAEPGVYSYVNKEQCEELVEYRLVLPGTDHQVREAEQLALAAWRALGCRDGGRIDLRADAAGRPQFLEANPLAGLHPAHSDLPMLATALGIPYVELIGQIVASAVCRCRAVATA